MLNELPLKSVQAFEAASRHLSFKRAAKELEISPSAVTYRILQLEAFLGLRLFERGNRKVNLTKEGQAYARHCKAGMEEFFGGIEEIRARRSKVHLDVGISMSNTWLAHRLPVFFAAYPDIELDISSAEMFWSLPEEGADAELVGIQDETLDSEVYSLAPFEADYALPVMSASLLSRHGGSADEALLRESILLHDMNENIVGMSTWPLWLDSAGYKNVDAHQGMRFDISELALSAAEHDCGIAIGRMLFSHKMLADGRLVAPYDKVIRLNRTARFSCHLSRLEDWRIRALRDWLQQEALEHDRAVAEFLKDREIIDRRF